MLLHRTLSADDSAMTQCFFILSMLYTVLQSSTSPIVAQEPGLSTGRIAGIVVGVLAPLAIGIAVLVIIIVLFKKNPKMKEKARKLFTRQPKKKEEQEERYNYITLLCMCMPLQCAFP